MQSYLAEPQGIGGVHGVQARDGGEFPLQGHGHGRGHGFGSGPGEIGAHQNRGEVHVGEVAHRQIPVGDNAEQQNGRHDQGGHDRTFDEGRGDAQGLISQLIININSP